ncbi:MAG: universal stress protein, partial [Patescibacteria group bacterium]
LPLAPYLSMVEIKNLAETAFALTSKFDGELVIVRIHEIPPSLALSPSMISQKTLEQEKKLFEQLQQWVIDYNIKTGPEKKDINFHSLILIGRDVVDVILDVVKMEDCDLLMLNWYGYKQTKGVMLSSKIDRILRESKCDLLVVKDPQPMQSILVAVHPSARSPYIEQIGEIAGGLKDYYKPKMNLLGIVSQEIPSYLKPDPTELLKALKLKRKDFDEISLEPGDSVAGSILKKANNQKHDLIIIGSAQPRFLSHFKLGSVAEVLAKHSNDSLMIVRGHEGAAEAFFKQILSKFKPKQKSQ